MNFIFFFVKNKAWRYIMTVSENILELAKQLGIGKMNEMAADEASTKMLNLLNTDIKNLFKDKAQFTQGKPSDVNKEGKNPFALVTKDGTPMAAGRIKIGDAEYVVKVTEKDKKPLFQLLDGKNNSPILNATDQGKFDEFCKSKFKLA
jgi:hypothetical protein